MHALSFDQPSLGAERYYGATAGRDPASSRLFLGARHLIVPTGNSSGERAVTNRGMFVRDRFSQVAGMHRALAVESKSTSPSLLRSDAAALGYIVRGQAKTGGVFGMIDCDPPFSRGCSRHQRASPVK